MIIVLLLSLLVTTFKGLMTLGTEGKGPFADTGTSVIQLAHADSDEHGDEDRPHSQAGGNWKEIHGLYHLSCRRPRGRCDRFELASQRKPYIRNDNRKKEHCRQRLQ